MSDSQKVTLREKQEVATKDEKTVPGRFYVPATDIYETEQALTVVMELPGVDREHVHISLDNDRLRVEGHIDVADYEGMEPLYTEYGVGNYARSFELSGRIDQDHISAEVADGVLTLTLPKVKEAQPRRILIS
jgi:HSP20 family protein